MVNATEHKLQIYLPGRLYRYLKSAAQRKGVSLSAYLRGLVDEEMRNGACDPDDPIFAYRRIRHGTGVRDASRHVDRYVYGENA